MNWVCTQADGRTFAFIAENFKSRLAPWQQLSITGGLCKSLRSAVYHDRSTAAGCAKYWKAGNELAGYRAC